MRELTSSDVLKQQKARAQRVDHTYYNKPHAWRTWMRRLSLGLPLLGALIIGAMTYSSQGANLYQPGPVSTRHAMFSHRCADCHEPVGRGFGAVSNAKCLVCHDGPLHSDRQKFDGPDKLTKIVNTKFSGEVEVEAHTPRCASCHTEHRGATSLQSVNDSHCTQCHAALEVNDGKKTAFAPSIKGFAPGLGHPEFRALLPNPDNPGVGRDPTPLRFNHVAHLNAKKVKFSETSAKGERGVRCSDCHVQDEQRRYMAPISYDKHCAECHVLNEVAGILPPHGKADDIRARVRVAYMNDVMAKKKPAPKDKGDLYKTIDGILNDDLFARDDQAKSGTCMYCHQPNTHIESNVVIEPNIPSRWFKHSFFNHETHRVIQCEDCHAAALGSKLTSDVLLPNVESCRTCHKAGNARSDCFECHIYHDKTNQLQMGTVTIDGLLKQGAAAAKNPVRKKETE